MNHDFETYAVETFTFYHFFHRAEIPREIKFKELKKMTFFFQHYLEPCVPLLLLEVAANKKDKKQQ